MSSYYLPELLGAITFAFIMLGPLVWHMVWDTLLDMSGDIIDKEVSEYEALNDNVTYAKFHGNDSKLAILVLVTGGLWLLVRPWIMRRWTGEKMNLGEEQESGGPDRMIVLSCRVPDVPSWEQSWCIIPQANQSWVRYEDYYDGFHGGTFPSFDGSKCDWYR